jgi:ABC-type glycerol-3-phosphate transport system substrate-binding protein
MQAKKLSRRQFVRATAVMGGTALLAACAPQAPAAPAAPAATAAPAAATPAPQAAAPATGGTTTVDIWIQQTSITVMKPSSDKFSEKNPDIKVNMVPTPIDETANKVLAAIAAGAGAPDAAFIQYTDMIKFTLRGGKGLRDLTPIMGTHRDDWVKWCLDIVTTKDNHLLGLPEDLGIYNTFYRRDVFDAAGMKSDPDSVAKALATWDDVLAVGKQLTKEGQRWMINTASEVFDILRQKQGQRYFDDNGQPVVNSKQYVDAANFAKGVRKAGIDAKLDWWGTDWTSVYQNKQGKVALYPCAAWWDQIIEPAAPDTKGLWGVVNMPDKSFANGGGSYFCFPEMSQKIDAAFKVCSYIEASDEGLTYYMQSGKFLPGYRKFYSNPIFTTPDPFFGGQAWLKMFGDIVDNVPEIHLDLNDGTAGNVLNDAIKDILDKDADPQARLDQANEEIKKQIAA